MAGIVDVCSITSAAAAALHGPVTAPNLETMHTRFALCQAHGLAGDAVIDSSAAPRLTLSRTTAPIALRPQGDIHQWLRV